jgi:uncharacterized repeat protein (TIGR01451 family)
MGRGEGPKPGRWIWLGAAFVALLTAPLGAQIADPSAAGIAWLNGHQNLNGTWGALPELVPRDTARAVRVELLLHAGGVNPRNGLAWLGAQQALSPNEFLAEQALALTLGGLNDTGVLAQLYQQRATTGGDFGGFLNHNGNTYDSALALEAFGTQEALYAAPISAIATSLLARQNPDGGWGFDQGFASDPLFTAEVITAFTSLKTLSAPPAPLAAGQQYLLSRLQSDGSFGESVLETGASFRALAVSGYPVSSLPVSPLTYLASRQTPDGSWGIEDAYLTTRALEAYAANKPNLTIPAGGFTLSPSPATDGATVTATVKVTNAGVKASAATKVSVFVGDANGRNLGTANVAALNPGATVSPTVAFTASNLSGAPTLLAFVDPSNQIDEIREDDNQATATLTVNGKPDLQIFPNDISTTPAHLQPNQSGQLNIVIHNASQGSVTNVGYAVYDGTGSASTLLRKDVVASISGGGSQVVVIPVTLAGGSHTITATADPDNLIPESDKTNNTASRAIVVSNISNIDLRIAQGNVTATPSRPAAGTTVSIAAIVENLGTDPVQSFVGFYDGVPGAGGSLIAKPAVSIDPVSQTTLTISYTTSASTQVIYAVADPDDTVPEIDETNNTAFAELTDQVADLSVGRTGLVLPRTPPLAGQNMTGRVVVRNIGLLPASQAEVLLYDDLPQNGGRQVADSFVDVPAGGSAVVSATWAARAGQHFATAVVNPTHSIVEPNYANNRVTKLYMISGASSLPDIFVDLTQRNSTVSPSIDLSGFAVSPLDLSVSGIVRVAVSIGNVTQPFAVTLFEDVDGDGAFNPEIDNPLGSTLVQPTSNPVIVQIAAQGAVRFAPGHILVYLDSGNSVVEKDETNNFVDIFEDCQTAFPPTTFTPLHKWVVPDLNLTSLAPVARMLDTNGDGVIDENDVPIVFQMSNNTVWARRGDTGEVVWSQGGMSDQTMTLAVGDVDGDGHTEVIAHAYEHRLVCIADDGHIKWTSAELDRDPNWDYYLTIGGGFVIYAYAGAPTIADLDGDGHPEVISGRTVLDGATGAVKWVGTAGRGRAWDLTNDNLYFEQFPDQEVPIAVDLDGDGKLEVVAGNTAYRSNGAIYWYRSDLPDGYTAALHLSGDPLPKVCLVALGNAYLLNHDGTTVWGPVAIPSNVAGTRTLLGGAPTVFMNGSNGPLIGVAGDGTYTVLNAITGAVVWTKVVSTQTAFNTATNSATAFDFGSGMALAYNSWDTFYILKASDGSVLYQEANPVYPYYPGEPAVCDVDNDGRADIVVPGLRQPLGLGMHLIGDPSWNTSASVFNEAAYHVTNVTESGGIPKTETDTTFSKVHYRANPSTFLAGVVGLPNLTASYVRVDTRGYPTFVRIYGRIGDMGPAGVPAGVPVAFYDGDPAAGGTLLGVSHTVAAMASSGFEDVSLDWPNPTSGSHTFYVVADDDGAHNGIVTECNESDNTGHSAQVALSVDLATDNNSISASDAFPRPGDTITLIASARLSGAVGPTVTAQFFLGDPTNGGTPISGILPANVVTNLGSSIAVVSFNWVVNASSGPQTISCFFDPQNVIAESDETNNVASTGIVVSTPDPIKKLVGTLTVTPPSAEPNTAVAIRALVQNQGNVPLSDVVLDYTVTLGGVPTFTGSITLASLAKFAYADLAVGSFTPAADGTYAVALTPEDPAVMVVVSATSVSVAPFAGATLTAVPAKVPISLPLAQCHLHVSRANTIAMPDDPLLPVIQQALERGLSWTSNAVIVYGVNQNCMRCHVQTQGIVAIEQTRSLAGITLTDAENQNAGTVFGQLTALQAPDGHEINQTSGYYQIKTPTILTAWSLSFWHDADEAEPYLLRSLSYLATVQSGDGSFPCDRCDGSFGNLESMTMMAVTAFARAHHETNDPTYLGPMVRGLQWELAYPYENAPPWQVARTIIGLEAGLPEVSDPTLGASIGQRVTTLAANLRSKQNPDGSFGNYQVYPILSTAQALYALSLAGARGDDPQVRSAITYILNLQRANGGWSERTPSDPNDQNQALWVDETTWAMIALPAAFRKLGEFDVDASVTLPSSVDLASSSIPPASAASITEGTTYVWHFAGVTDTGSDLYFNVKLNGIGPGQTLPVASAASLQYADPYSGDPLGQSLAIPSVTGFAPLDLTITTDRGSYSGGDTVMITETVTNVGTTSANITNDLEIRDSTGLRVATVAAADPVSGLPPLPFAGWHYSVPVTFSAPAAGGTSLVAFSLSFTQLLGELGAGGTFDPNSIRISSDDNPAAEWYFSYQPGSPDPASGQIVVDVPSAVVPGSVVALHVYFDVLENGLKPASPFNQLTGTGSPVGGLLATYYLLDSAHSNTDATDPSQLVFIEPPIVQRVENYGGTLPPGLPPNYWATVYTGAIYAYTTGQYIFDMGSIDRAWLYLDGQFVMSPGAGAFQVEHRGSANPTLSQGYHSFKLIVFHVNGYELFVEWLQPGKNWEFLGQSPTIFTDVPATSAADVNVGSPFAVPSTPVTLTYLWNTGTTAAGPYSAVATLRQSGAFVNSAGAGFAIASASQVSASVATDKTIYDPPDIVHASGGVRYASGNTLLSGLSATISIVGPSGVTLASSTSAMPQMSPGQTMPIGLDWPVGSSPAGTYQATLSVRNPSGNILATQGAPFTVRSTSQTGLGVSATASAGATVPQGGALAFTITVTNAGNAALTGASFAIQILDPTTQALVDTVPFTVSVGVGGISTLTIPYVTSKLGVQNYTAYVVSLISGSPQPLASLTFKVLPVADLSVAMTASPDPATQTKNLTYAITVANAGPSDASGVTLTDTLPSGVTFVSATAGTGSCTGTGPVVCALGSLAKGGTDVVTLVITPNSAGSITNTASVAGEQGDLNLANNTASSTTTVKAAIDLSVSMSASPDPVLQTKNVTYTMTVGNGGPSGATGVTLTDSLPGGATFVSVTSSTGSCSGSATITCALGNLAKGSSATVTLVLRADTSGALADSASVAANEIDLDSSNDTAAATVTVNAAVDLSVTMTDSPDPVAQGKNVTYTATVANAGPSGATGVTLVDTLPAGTTFVSATASAGSCSGSGPVTCTLGSLAKGATATVTVVVTANAQGTISNSVSVTSTESDLDASNNAAQESTTVNGLADLALALTASPDPATQGQNLTYTATVTNAGPSDASGVTLTDNPPTGTTFVSATPSIGSCTGTGPVVCALGNLAKGGTATVAILVTPTSGSPVTDSASVSASETDPAPANNAASLTVQVSAEIELEASVSSSPRVLIWANCSPGNSGKSCSPQAPPFLTQTLYAAGIPSTLVGDENSFIAAVRTGAFSAAVIYLPPSAEPKIAAEYLEDIHAAFGLLLIKNHPDAMPKLSPALGVSFAGKLKGPTTVNLLQTPFTAPGTLTFNGDGVKITLAGALAAANIAGGSSPAISYNTYGRGRVVVIPFDTEATATSQVGSLLLSAINYVSVVPGSAYFAREVLPVELHVTTPPGGPVDLAISATPPAGASVLDAAPSLSSNSPPTWDVTLDGNTQETFSLWVREPDAAGAWSLTATAGFQGQAPITTQIVTLDVAADETALANQLLADLTALQAEATLGSDLSAISDAMSQLDAIQAVSNPDANGVLSDIQRCLTIAADLGSLSLDASAARADLDVLFVYWQSRAGP